MSEKLLTTMRDGKRMNDMGSFSVAETNPPSHHLSVRSPAFDGKLAMPLYLIDGVHRRAMCRTVDDFGIDWACFARWARAQLLARKDGTAVTNKDMISV